MDIGDKVTLKSGRGCLNGKIIAEYPAYYLVQHKNYKEAYLKYEFKSQVLKVR